MAHNRLTHPWHHDPVERIVGDALLALGYAFEHEVVVGNRSLDFYITDLDLYIEVKQFSTPRTADQIAGLTNVLVVQGIPAALAFVSMLKPRT